MSRSLYSTPFCSHLRRFVTSPEMQDEFQAVFCLYPPSTHVLMNTDRIKETFLFSKHPERAQGAHQCVLEAQSKLQQSKPGSSKRSASLKSHYRNPVYTSNLLHTCYMLRPPHYYGPDHPNNIW